MNRKRWGTLKTLSLSALLVTASAPVYARTGDNGVVVKTNFRSVDEERAKRIEPVLRRHVGQSLRLSGFEVAETSNITLVFHVRALAEDPNPAAVVSDYGTHIEILLDGERVGEQVVTFCDQMDEAELVECALQGLAQALPLIPRQQTPSRDNPAVPSPSPSPEHNDNTPKKPGTAYIWGGAAAIFVGTGTLVAGAALHAYERTETTNLVQTKEQYARSLTIPLMVGGPIMMAGGVALIIIGTRKNKQHRQRKMALLPSRTSDSWGVTLQGRF